MSTTTPTARRVAAVIRAAGHDVVSTTTTHGGICTEVYRPAQADEVAAVIRAHGWDALIVNVPSIARHYVWTSEHMEVAL